MQRLGILGTPTSEGVDKASEEFATLVFDIADRLPGMYQRLQQHGVQSVAKSADVYKSAQDKITSLAKSMETFFLGPVMRELGHADTVRPDLILILLRADQIGTCESKEQEWLKAIVGLVDTKSARRCMDLAILLYCKACITPERMEYAILHHLASALSWETNVSAVLSLVEASLERLADVQLDLEGAKCLLRGTELLYRHGILERLPTIIAKAEERMDDDCAESALMAGLLSWLQERLGTSRRSSPLPARIAGEARLKGKLLTVDESTDLVAHFDELIVLRGADRDDNPIELYRADQFRLAMSSDLKSRVFLVATASGEEHFVIRRSPQTNKRLRDLFKKACLRYSQKPESVSIQM